MNNLITRYFARRGWAAAFAALLMQDRRSPKQHWLHRHLQHHAIFREYMQKGRALQQNGFSL